ncbi:DUF3010 family protein [Thalassospira sp.]|uniref:DUF3010 family protein n=1 Tax=Thalassospira sp. TaxID=1912094 RepID=UPI0032EAA411
MKVIGIDFNAHQMCYIVIEGEQENFDILDYNKIALSSTRSSGDLQTFQVAVSGLLKDATPNKIAIKQKNEKGFRSMGPAGLKMEGLLLASAECEVVFISSKKTQKIELESAPKKFVEDALKSAISAL